MPDFDRSTPLKEGQCRVASLNKHAKCQICGVSGEKERIVALTGLRGVVKACGPCLRSGAEMTRIPT